MKTLMNFAFDFFGYLLPGLWIIGSFLLIVVDLDSIASIIDYIISLKTNAIFFVTIIAYIIGFSIDPLGKILYKYLGFKIWDLMPQTTTELSISEKFVLVREHSPRNFKYIEIWHMYCSMSYNFSVASLIMLFSCIVNLFNYPSNWIFWVLSSLVSIILFFLLLYRAVLFSSWAALDLDAAILKLKLTSANTSINN